METWSEFLLALAVNTKYFLENNFSNIKCKVDKRYLNIKNKFIRIIQRSTSIHIRHYKHSSTPDFASSNAPNLSFFFHCNENMITPHLKLNFETTHLRKSRSFAPAKAVPCSFFSIKKYGHHLF
jgi:hypothetical protein